MGCVWGVEEEEERGRREGGRRKGEARRGEALCSREGNEGGRGSSGRARTWKKGIQTHPGTPQRAVWRCHALSPLPSSARRWPSTAVQGLLTGCPCHGRLGAGPGLRWPERGPTPPRALPSMTAPTPRCSADCLRGALRPATTLREAPWKPFILQYGVDAAVGFRAPHAHVPGSTGVAMQAGVSGPPTIQARLMPCASLALTAPLHRRCTRGCPLTG